MQAAQATGAGPLRVVFRHIAPDALPSLVVHLALAASAAVLEAGLSFLGLGVRPPLPSLSGLINASKTYLRLAWWYVFFPGVVLAAMVLSFNFLADAISMRPRAPTSGDGEATAVPRINKRGNPRLHAPAGSPAFSRRHDIR